MGDSTFSSCAYCWESEKSWDNILSFKCEGCKKNVHYGCIKSAQPSPLLEDTFFTFKCQACGENGKEEFQRSNLSWQNVVHLTLYNLQKMGQGKCGFYHWRGHVCAFIETNWIIFFGHRRKKTTLWMGTVAGALSSGCPHLFLSGTNIVEQGYWRLAVLEPPIPSNEKKKPKDRKKTPSSSTDVDLYPEERKCRRSRENALSAAIELKKKRSVILDTKEMKRQKRLKEEEKFTLLRETDDIPNLQSKLKSWKSKGNKKQKKRHKGSIIKETNIFTPASMETQCTLEEMDIPYLSDDAASVASSEMSQATTSSFSSSLMSSAKDEITTSQLEKGEASGDLLNAIKIEPEDDDYDIDIGYMMSTSYDMPDLRPTSPDVGIMLNLDTEEIGNVSGKSPVSKRNNLAMEVKEEYLSDSESEGPSEGDIDEDSTDESDESCNEEEEQSDKGDKTVSGVEHKIREDTECVDQDKSISVKNKRGRPRKRRRIDDAQPSSPPPRLKRISVFEEEELLQKLNETATKQTLRPELAQLRRKLICNQTNREYGLPVFDLEIQMDKLARMDNSAPQTVSSQNASFFPKLPSKASQTKETRDLDRFMIHDKKKKVESRTYTSFHQRLVGLQDHELKPVVSPYTTRVLLPFIWRNYNLSKKPLKLRLLQEIQAYPHRNDPSWKQPPHPPIDYCYVRPEHIPSVNALCREFFWPGVDMSECLQYPDFSCVALYRKIVIAFAFMVPDRGYNEAYISFIFTHPEWRGAGIATFMLYHLIQTCMGKDVLLHVSATNPAMLMYQKFGFKAQELILNFYHKYFPHNSKDSTHAFLMRLTR